MTHSELLKVLTYLSHSFPGKFNYPKEDDRENEMFEKVWLDQLEGFEYGLVIQAARNYVRKGNPWPPAVGELVKICDDANKTDEDRMTAEEAWEKFQRIASVYGVYREDEALKQLPTRIRRTIDILGGFFKVATYEDDRGFLEKRFREVYDNISETEAERERLPGNGKPKLSGKRDEVLKKITGGDHG